VINFEGFFLKIFGKILKFLENFFWFFWKKFFF